MSSAQPEQDQEVYPGACSVCGSTGIMADVMVADYRDGPVGELQVSIALKPDALLFKQRVERPVRAWVYSACGHVELFVKDPQRLYQAYLASPGSKVE